MLKRTAKKTGGKGKKAAGPKDRRAALAEVAASMKGWEPATDVFTRVASVPTIFPHVDWATRVGGWPIERVTVVQGPSNQGKTLLAHGIGLSFLKLDHFCNFLDAERTTPITWLEQLMGEYVGHPGFLGKHPDTYEQAIELVRTFAYGIDEARAKKVIPCDTTGIAILDSLGKLMPKGLLDHLVGKVGKHGVDGADGRAGQIMANLNKSWLNELIPLLHKTRTGMIMIVRERIEKDGRIVRIVTTGGNHVVFESSLTARVTHEWVKWDDVVVGEAHKVAFRKTKVGAKQDSEDVGWFHTSNGKVAPVGFWRAMDLFGLGMQLGVLTRENTNAPVEVAGVEVIGKTAKEAVAALGDPQRADMVERMCRERFGLEAAS